MGCRVAVKRNNLSPAAISKLPFLLNIFFSAFLHLFFFLRESTHIFHIRFFPPLPPPCSLSHLFLFFFLSLSLFRLIVARAVWMVALLSHPLLFTWWCALVLVSSRFYFVFGLMMAISQCTEQERLFLAIPRIFCIPKEREKNPLFCLFLQCGF